MCLNCQKTADLVTYTDGILNGKLRFWGKDFSMVTIDRNELKAPTWIYEIKQMTQNQIIFFRDR